MLKVKTKQQTPKQTNKQQANKSPNPTSINLTYLLVLRSKCLLIYICTQYITTSCPTWCLSLGKIYVSQSFCFVHCGFIIFGFALLGVSFNSHLFCLSHNSEFLATRSVSLICYQKCNGESFMF